MLPFTSIHHADACNLFSLVWQKPVQITYTIFLVKLLQFFSGSLSAKVPSWLEGDGPTWPNWRPFLFCSSHPTFPSTNAPCVLTSYLACDFPFLKCSPQHVIIHPPVHWSSSSFITIWPDQPSLTLGSVIHLLYYFLNIKSHPFSPEHMCQWIIISLLEELFN